MIVAVCALTYKRPQGLTRLLDGLAQLTFRETAPEINIVIVDNDPESTARSYCESRRATLGWPLKYVGESKRGIAPARNAALNNIGEADWIGFIDDDEVPGPHWLDELLRVQRAHDADVVGGAVLPCFAEPPPAWARQGGFFDQNRHATGTRRPYVYTNNVLFRARILREMNLRFDERWALMGCEDLHFFQQIGLAGYKIVWADEAIVADSIPASRVTVRWVLQRGYRYGNSASCVDLDLRPGLMTRLRLLAIGSYRIFKGLFFLPLTWPFGRHLSIMYLRHICVGTGFLTGLFGTRYEEYRTTHGS